MNNALTQLSTAVSTNNPAAVTGQAQIITLTPGIDTISTPSPNVTFFAPDVLVAGTLVTTLNPGDSLTDTAATSTATLSILTSASFTTIHDSSGFTTSGVPNLLIQNNAPFGMALNGSGMTGLTTITSQNAGLGADTFLTGIQNKVALDVTGSVAELTLSYANPITGAQALVLNGAVSQPGTAIDFLGAHAPASLAVSLTGNSTVNIFDAALTTITATSTDTGMTNTLRFFDGANNTVLNADFSAAKGNLTVFFANDTLANGASIVLGAQDTLTVGHLQDIVNVTGNGGVYNITLGNQNDNIILGAHGTGDTLTFTQPNITIGTGVLPGASDNVFFPNIATDTYNFSVSGFSTPAVNPASFGVATTLLATGNPFVAGMNATPIAPGAALVTQAFTGAFLDTNNGVNLIVDTNPADTSAAAVLADITGAGGRIDLSFAPTRGAFLFAYAVSNGVEIAEVTVGTNAAGGAAPSFLTAPGSTGIHNLVDLVGVNLASFQANASHLLHFVA